MHEFLFGSCIRGNYIKHTQQIFKQISKYAVKDDILSVNGILYPV